MAGTFTTCTTIRLRPITDRVSATTEVAEVLKRAPSPPNWQRRAVRGCLPFPRRFSRLGKLPPTGRNSLRRMGDGRRRPRQHVPWLLRTGLRLRVLRRRRHGRRRRDLHRKPVRNFNPPPVLARFLKTGLPRIG